MGIVLFVSRVGFDMSMYMYIKTRGLFCHTGSSARKDLLLDMEWIFCATASSEKKGS